MGGLTRDLVTPESRVNTGVREVVHRRELTRRLLGGPRAGLPNGPIFRLREGLFGPLLVRDEVEILVGRGVKVVRLLTVDNKQSPAPTVLPQ